MPSKLLSSQFPSQIDSYKPPPQYLYFFCYQQFFIFFSHTTQHNIQNTTKQNNRLILNISRFNQKGGREGRTTRTQKLLLYIITYIQQKTLPSINGRGPGPTNSRRCTFTWHNLQEATDPICFSTHVWCKPVLYYCRLHSNIYIFHPINSELALPVQYFLCSCLLILVLACKR